MYTVIHTITCDACQATIQSEVGMSELLQTMVALKWSVTTTGHLCQVCTNLKANPISPPPPDPDMPQWLNDSTETYNQRFGLREQA